MKSIKITLALVILFNSLVSLAGPQTGGGSSANRTPASIECDTPEKLMSANVNARDFSLICRRIVSDDPGCKKLKPEKRMSCNSRQENEILSTADLLSKAGQCAKGFLWDSMVDLATFVFDIIKLLVGAQIKTYSAMFDFLTDSEFRQKTLAATQNAVSSGSRLGIAFLNQASLYFAREFQRNLAKNPLNPLAAAGETLLAPLLKFMTESIQSIIATYVPQYQCMNGTAKLYTICKLAGDFIMPPVFMFTMLKSGVRGLQALRQGANARKIAQFERGFAEANEIKTAVSASRSANEARSTAITVNTAESAAKNKPTAVARPEIHPVRPQPAAPLTKPIEEHNADELIEVARSSRVDEVPRPAPAVRAADEAEDISTLMVAYKTDPEYGKLFPKRKPYAEFDEELSVVISHMERTNPGMSKAKIREEIEKSINSCPL